VTLEHPILCLVTAGTLRRGNGGTGPILEALLCAARAGVNLIQIRERELDDRSLLTFVRAALQSVESTRARVVVNDRVDIALAAGAAGVHLRGDSVAASEVRRIVPPGFIIGRSVHDEGEAAAAAADGGCDYLTFGTVFPSASKPEGHRSAGVNALRRVAARVPIPVLAIGGMSIERAPAIAAAGAAGIAAIGLFARSTALAEDVARLRRAFDTRSRVV
jgi:thiamine-phosphate diphosphorylase